MSNRVVVSLFAVLSVLGGFESRLHAQDAEKGASLLAEARKAIGGEDKLRALKTVQANGSFKRTAGNNTLEGDFEIFIEQPNRYRRKETTGNAGGPIGERVEVLNGTEVWEESSNGFPGGRFGFGAGFGRGGGFGDGGGRGRAGGGRDGGQADGGRAGAAAIDPERLREAQRRQRQNELARLMLMWFLTTDAPVAWVGTAQAPDGTADVIEVKPAEGAATRVFLDSATHMPLMMTTTGFGGGRGRRGGGADGRAGGADGRAGGADGRAGGPPPPITIETHLSEYKAVNGIKLPHLITRGVNGQTNEEWEIKNYRINPNLKQNTFTK
jgi:outer membrane lipoprotein-sorting protein